MPPIRDSHATTIGRDTYARLDIIRRTVGKAGDKCTNCGQSRKRYISVTVTQAAGTQRLFRDIKLFQYGTETDNYHQSWDLNAFCGKECRDDFYRS